MVSLSTSLVGNGGRTDKRAKESYKKNGDSGLMVIVPDEQGHACEGDDKFEGNDKDVVHKGSGFNGLHVG